MGSFDKLVVIFILLSLGGLPPFLGFLGKLLILKNFLIYINILMLLIILYRSIIVLIIYIYYCYIGVCYSPFISIQIIMKYQNFYRIIYIFTLFILPPYIIIL